MIIKELKIKDIKLISLTVFEDERGYFFESFNKSKLLKVWPEMPDFVQENESLSKQGVLRGLHYQVSPSAQGKLVRCLEGVVFDVAVDLRKNSSTFGQWLGYQLEEKNIEYLWIPPGFAHGFLVLSTTAKVHYKTTSYYSPGDERSLLWSDPDVNIKWPMQDKSKIILSPKDKLAKKFKELDYF